MKRRKLQKIVFDEWIYKRLLAYVGGNDVKRDLFNRFVKIFGKDC